MAAKRSTSTGSKSKNQKKPADQAEDTLSSAKDPDIIDAVAEPVVDAEITDAQPPEADEPSPSDAVEATDTGIREADAPSDLSAEEPTDSVDAVDEQQTADAEDQEEAADERADPQPERVVERVVETKSVFVPAVFGGVVAGLLGLAIGASDRLSALLPESMQRSVESEVSAEEVAALRDQIAQLEAQLAQPVEAPDLSGIEAQIAEGLAEQAAAFAAADTALTDRVDALSAQVTELAQAPLEGSVSDEAIAAYENELAAVQSALAQQRAEVEAMIAEAAQMEAEASESARIAQAQAAATRLFAALDSGSAFANEVSELQNLGVTVPDALAAASDGLASLGALQADFPDLARAALSASRDADGGSTGVTGFLQRQLGARSVTPRDGEDPDAILSRVEGALTQGDLAQALAEMEALPDVAKAPLADWAAAARARQAALGAADDLAQSLASN